MVTLLHNFLVRRFFSTNHKVRIVCSSINFKTLFNRIVNISSFSILPPNSLGKISMFTWFSSQYQDSFFMFCCSLAIIFMFMIAIVGFLLYYVYYKKDTFFVDEFLPYLQKISFPRKVILGSFTLFTAIPNKFWVNVKIHFLLLFIISAIVYLLGLIFPIFFFCYFVYLVLCFESLIFGLLYDYSEHFRKLINFLLFGQSNEPFAIHYFSWFWGNMWRQAAQKLAPLVAGGTAIEAKRQQENSLKNSYADKHTDQAAIQSQNGFRNPTERAEFHKARRDEWVQENGTVTRVMKAAEDWWSAGS